MRPLDPDHDLHPATIEAMQNLAPTVLPLASDVTEAELVTFALGLATSEEREKVVALLVQSPELRSRLVEIHSILKQGVTPEAVEKNPSIFETLNLRVVETLETFGSIRRWCVSHGWNDMQASFGPEAAAARSALTAACSNLRFLYSSPRFATTRAGERDFVHRGEVPVGVEVNLFVEIDADGNLQARATFIEQVRDAAAPLIGRSIFLELLDPSGGTIPVGSAVASKEEWSLSAAGFGGVTGLPSGSLPASMFVLSFGNGMTLPRSLSHLFVDTDDGDMALFEIVEEPRIADGQFVVTLAASESIRNRFAAYSLELSVPVGTATFRIGKWRMDEWKQDIKTFRSPIQGPKSSSIRPGSILKGTLVRS